MKYSNHFESVYCISGTGDIEALASGGAHPVTPGTIYVLNKHDEHILRARTELVLACVFNPPLNGREVHDETGAYPLEAESVTDERSQPNARGFASAQQWIDEYPSRRASAPVVIPRKDLVVYSEWRQRRAAHGGANGVLRRQRLSELRYRPFRGVKAAALRGGRAPSARQGGASSLSW